MKETSRIRFNPGTGEIEVEGSEKFVKTYFNKLERILSGAARGAREPKAGAVRSSRKRKPAADTRKGASRKTAPAMGKKRAGKKRTNIDTVVSLIQGSTGGISTAELKGKTGLTDAQIWNIVNRTAKEGKIRKVKRGLYAAL